MKRSGPPKRKTQLGRGTSQLKRTPINQKSDRRREQEQERARVRAIVHDRAGGRCQYAAVWPDIECGSPWPRRPKLEVDELRGGSYRSVEWLNPDACRLTCQIHHDHKTLNKPEHLRRLRMIEGDTDARE